MLYVSNSCYAALVVQSNSRWVDGGWNLENK